MSEKGWGSILVEIKMLGGFELSVDGHTVSDSVGRTHQLWNLLEYLISNRHKTVSQQELIDTLWPDEGSENPANALKNLVYRIRTTFAASGIPCARDLITYRRGTYRWNNEIPCVVDVEEFEKIAGAMENPRLTAEQCVAIGSEAIRLYRGDFLPLSAYESWVVPLSAYYRSLYFKCVDRVVGLLLQMERYEQVYDICAHASEIDQFEERVHRFYIEALIREGKTSAALARYHYVTELFYRELGVRPSEEFTALYGEITRVIGNEETDLRSIATELCEQDGVPGAFYCDYEVFKNLYRIEARAAARTGQVVFVGLITVTGPQDEPLDAPSLSRVMQELKEVIRSSLRRGDVVSRVSAHQFVLMLPTLTYENGEMVLNRICKRYKNDYRNRKVKLRVSLQPLEPIQ